MSHDSERSRLLIRQTDNAGAKATLAEIERANQLGSAECEISRLRRFLAETHGSLLRYGFTDDDLLLRIKAEAKT